MTRDYQTFQPIANDKHYTRLEVARSCHHHIRRFLSVQTCLLEPSAGAGAFVETCDANRSILAFDIAPDLSRGVEIAQADFLAPTFKDRLLTGIDYAAIGNPPFGKQSLTALAFLNKALALTGLVGMILPRVFKRWSVQSRVMPGARLLLDIDLPAYSFEFDGRPYDVNACFQVWSLRHPSKPDLRLAERPPISHPHFEMRMYNTQRGQEWLDSSWWAFALFRTGVGDYRPLLRGAQLNPRRQYILVKAEGEVLRRLLLIDYKALASGYTTVPGFSLADVVAAYERVVAQEAANDNRVFNLRKVPRRRVG